MNQKLTIGVLALQGCVEPHRYHLNALGVEYREARSLLDLAGLNGIIIPGGESTTMLKVIQMYDLETELRRIFARVPVWGVCAGAILLAKEVVPPSQQSFKMIDMTVRRNAYGRQQESFQAEIAAYPVHFIRAPIFQNLGLGVEVFAEHNGHPVWVRQGHVMATSFHSELATSGPSPMHQIFVEMVKLGKLATGPAGRV